MSDILAAKHQSVFEQLKRIDKNGEYWTGRDLMTALGYSTWQKFSDAIDRARAACENSGQSAGEHFLTYQPKTTMGRPKTDFYLTRYACYLTAMNGDPRKVEIAAAQTYFVVQTHRAETAAELAPPAPAAVSPLAQARLMLEVLEQQDARVTALEHHRDTSPITSEKVGTIHRLGQQLGQCMGNYGQAWRLFNNHFRIASYRDLPNNRFEEAVRFLRVQISAYTGTPLLEVEA